VSAPAWDPLDELTPAQRGTLEAYRRELVDLNRRVNLVSPASAADAERRHVVHSLALGYRSFPAGATVVDFGAGGGLPSVPLAIRFPGVRFVAIDAASRKAEAVRLFARRLSLANLEVWHGRAEAWPGRADYAVSRATAPLADLWAWFVASRAPAPAAPAGGWTPGLVCLKGGDLEDELADLGRRHPGLAVERIRLGGMLGDPYFDAKEIVAVSGGRASSV